VDPQEFGLSEIPDGDDCDGAFDEGINRSLLSIVAKQHLKKLMQT
jgi:hypothetical protein